MRIGYDLNRVTLFPDTEEDARAIAWALIKYLQAPNNLAQACELLHALQSQCPNTGTSNGNSTRADDL
jgi:hypothetical protein